MLDKTTAIVLNTINDQCKDNSYIVLKNEDITPGIPRKKRLDDEGVKETIDYLAEREYIKLKYSDEATYCLTILPKGRLYNEDRKEQKFRLKQENKRNNGFLIKIAFISAVFAFLGAMFANYLL
jgi:hypothetical protein